MVMVASRARARRAMIGHGSGGRQCDLIVLGLDALCLYQIDGVDGLFLDGGTLESKTL